MASVLASVQAVVCEDADEDIIQELVALQQVPVMAKLQFLLRSICSRLVLQGSKIEKAEEQGRTAALLKDEFEHLSKRALEESKAEKEAEQNNWSKLMEDRLKGLDDIAKQYGDVVAGLQGADLSILQTLPTRLSAIEEKTPGLQEGKDWNDTTSQQSGPPLNERMEALQENFDDQNDRISRLEEQIKELKAIMQDAAKAYSSDIESLQKICRNLRSDIEILPILDISAPRESLHEPSSVNPELGVALTEIQNRLQRKADYDTVDQLVRSTAQTKEGLEKIKSAFDELKQQVRSVMPGASRRASLTNIQTPAIETIAKEMASQIETTLDPNIIPDITVEQKVLKSFDGELLDGRLKHLEGEIVTLETQLAGKADRKDLDGLQIQMTFLEGGHPGSLSSLARFTPDGVLMEITPEKEIQEVNQEQKNYIEDKSRQQPEGQPNQGDDHPVPQQALQQEKQAPDAVLSIEFQKIKSSYVALQVTLQKLQELISKKADRDELLQLHESIHRQRAENPHSQLPSSGSFDNENNQQMYKTLVLEIENMNNKMKKLEERSDLNVLISKRLENFAQPAATVQETSQGLNEMKDAINEHADRMMEYADTLLQMEALLATKADASGLQALRASILELKKRSKEQLRPSSAESMLQSKQVWSQVLVQNICV